MALFIGVLVYVVDRPPQSICFLPEAFIRFGEKPKIFGIIGNNLPTFTHVFAFTLITVGFFYPTQKNYLIICIGWLLIDLFFELGQYRTMNNKIVDCIPEWFNALPILKDCKNFFLTGTFDPFDLLSIFLGSTLAYLVIIRTKRREESL